MLISPVDNPRKWFKFLKVPRYHSNTIIFDESMVDTVLRQMGPYTFGDEKSEEMLVELDEGYMNRALVKIDNEDATYLGQWSGTRRHGRGL